MKNTQTTMFGVPQTVEELPTSPDGHQLIWAELFAQVKLGGKPTQTTDLPLWSHNENETDKASKHQDESSRS